MLIVGFKRARSGRWVAGYPGLSLASELRAVGNRFAHEFGADAFDPASVGRALQQMEQLLLLVGARQQASLVRALMSDDRRAPTPGPATPQRPQMGAYGPSGSSAARRPSWWSRNLVGWKLGCLGIVGAVFVAALAVSFFDKASNPVGPTPTPTGSHHPHIKDGGLIGSFQGIDLADNYDLDLTSDPTHPMSTGGDLHLGDLPEGLAVDTNPSGDRLTALDPGIAGSYQSCRQDTRHLRGAIALAAVPSKELCLTRPGGVIGLIKIISIQDRDPGSHIVLDLSVWQGPTPQTGH